MKNPFSFRILVGVITVIALLSGCKKDSTGPQTGSVTDIDGNTYTTITIGNQVWMTENLRVTHFRNGDALNFVTDNTQWGETTSAACCYYENNSQNGLIYGILYNWYAVSDSRNLAPDGWHVATDADWTTLIAGLGGASVAGGKLKEAGTSHWLTPNGGATNESGFTALPGGVRVLGGSFFELATSALWWTSSEASATEAWLRLITYYGSSVERAMNSKGAGIAVRCVKD